MNITPDQYDGYGIPTVWKLELFGGPMDGHIVRGSALTLEAVVRRGILTVKTVVDNRERHYRYERGADSKFRFAREIKANE